MAKKSMVEKNNRRRRLAKSYANRRNALKLKNLTRRLHAVHLAASLIPNQRSQFRRRVRRSSLPQTLQIMGEMRSPNRSRARLSFSCTE